MSDQSTVIGCVVVTGVVSVGADWVKNGGPSFKPVLGTFTLGALLLLVSMFSPDVASAFAVLILVTALLVNGNTIFTAIGKVTK